MLVPNRHGSSTAYRYGYSGKEKDDELKGEGNCYDFGARMLDPRVGRWFAKDPKENKYPSFSTYNYVANSPLRAIDPDGEDIFILFYTSGNKRGDEMFEAAALTRKVNIEKSKTFDPSKDKVVMIAIQDLSDVESKVANVVKNYSPKYGQTAEFGLWSHGALQGPVGTATTSSNALDGKQMTLEGWSKIDFNWKQDGSVSANFFGCRTGMDSYVPDGKGSLLTQKWKIEKSFSNKISNLNNFEDVLVTGQTNFSFPSQFTDYRLNSENGKDNFINSKKNGVINFQKTYMVSGFSKYYDLNLNEQNVALPMQSNVNGTTVYEAPQEGKTKSN